jgi:hypothetical protein
LGKLRLKRIPSCTSSSTPRPSAGRGCCILDDLSSGREVGDGTARDVATPGPAPAQTIGRPPVTAATLTSLTVDDVATVPAAVVERIRGARDVMRMPREPDRMRWAGLGSGPGGGAAGPGARRHCAAILFHRCTPSCRNRALPAS